MVERIGFLSFGHHQAVPGSRATTAGDALRQAIDLAVGAEEIGVDGAWIRVHHFQPQFASPWPLLAAMAARTTRLELGTAIIDMRYENPLGMAELAGATDLISRGRLQLGLSRGSQEPALRGYEAFGHVPSTSDADLARAHTVEFRRAVAGHPVASTDPAQTGRALPLPIHPQSDGLAERIWWGSATRSSARWTAEAGMNLLSSTLLSEDTGVPFHELQREQIEVYRRAWARAGHGFVPRVAVSRTVLPITTDRDREHFGAQAVAGGRDQVGVLGGAVSRFGKSFVGEPDAIVAGLAADTAVRAADTLLLTIPNLLGVDENLRLLDTVVRHVAPSLGWTRT